MIQSSSAPDSVPPESVDFDTTMANIDGSSDGLQTLPKTVQARPAAMPPHASESNPSDEQPINKPEARPSPSAENPTTHGISSVSVGVVSMPPKVIGSTVPDLSTNTQTHTSEAQTTSGSVVVKPLPSGSTQGLSMPKTSQNVSISGLSATAPPASANRMTISSALPKPGLTAAGTKSTNGQSSTQLNGAKSQPIAPPKPIPSTLLGYRSASSGAPILIGGVSTPLPQYTIASVPGITPMTSQVRNITINECR